MPVIRYVPPDPTDLVLQGEQMRIPPAFPGWHAPAAPFGPLLPGTDAEPDLGMAEPDLVAGEQLLLTMVAGDGMGYLPRPEGWEPLPPNNDPGAAKAYFPCVQNIVSTCDVMQPINPYLAAYVCHGRCDSAVFPAATVPILWPHGTISAFGTGRLVVSGVWEMLQGVAATQLFLCKLSEVTKIPYRIYNFRVENVVGSAAIGRRVRLRELASAHADDVLYTPETFAGLSYRPRERPECKVFRNGRPVVGVFPSGCMVFCGAYDLAHLVDTFLYMHEFLKPFLIH